VGLGGRRKPVLRAGFALLFAAALALAAVGCAGGQSGSEGCIDPAPVAEVDTNDTRIATDEDGGVEGDGGEPDGDTSFIANNPGEIPENADAPRQCVVTDGDEY
jgi:hypothetical protein